MFSPEFVLHSANNYGVVKTETVIGFGPKNKFHQNGLISSEPEEIFFAGRSFERSFKDSTESLQKQLKKSRNINNNEIMERRKDKKHSKHKFKKCIYKLLKGKKKKQKFLKFLKILLPLLIGVVAAKTILVPLALKVLAFVLFKGLLIGLVSATMMSLRGILSHSYGYHHRRGYDDFDGDRQIGNIYVPSKRKDSYKKYYQRNITIPYKVSKFNSENRRKH